MGGAPCLEHVPTELSPMVFRIEDEHLAHHTEQLILSHDHQVLAIELELVACILGEDDFSANVHTHRGLATAIKDAPGPLGQYSTHEGSLLGGLWDNEPPLTYPLGFIYAYYNPIS
jgi:hypothetical protein